MELLGGWLGIGGAWGVIATGAVGLTLAVAAHLKSKQRGPLRTLPTAAFLDQAAAQQAVGARVLRLALLAARLLLILVITAACLRPVWYGSTAATPADPEIGIDLAIVIDASVTMRREGVNGSLFSQAQSRAEAALATLDPARDRAAVIVARAGAPRSVLPDWTANIPALREHLRALQPTFEQASIEHALGSASVLSAGYSGDAMPRTRRTLVLSDLQSARWADITGGISGLGEVHVVSMAPRELIVNLGVTDLSLIGSPFAGGAGVIRATVRDGSGTGGQAIATFSSPDGSVDSAGSARQAVSVPAGGASTIDFPVRFPRVGRAIAAVSISGDGFWFDDTRRLVATVPEAPRVTIAAVSESERGTLLSKAFAASIAASLSIPLRSISIVRHEDLTIAHERPPNLIVLLGAGPTSGTEGPILSSCADHGIPVLHVTSPIRDGDSGLTKSGMNTATVPPLPGSLREVGNPLESLRGLLDSPRLWTWTDADAGPGSTSLLIVAGDPVISVSASRRVFRWSFEPDTPGAPLIGDPLFPLLVEQSVQFLLAGVPAQGSSFLSRAVSELVPGPEAVRIAGPTTEAPGFVELPGRGPGDPLRTIPVNVDADATTLTTADEAALSDCLNAAVTPPQTTREVIVPEGRGAGTAVWRALLAAGLLLIAAEFTLVFLSLSARRGTKSTDRLGPLGVRLGIAVLLATACADPSAPSSGAVVSHVKPQLTVLVDRSASMALKDASDPGDPASPAFSRAEAVRRGWLTSKTLASLEQHSSLTLLEFDANVSPIDRSSLRADPVGTASDINSALRACLPLKAEPTPGHKLQSRPTVLLLSDGIANPGMPLELPSSGQGTQRAPLATLFISTAGPKSSGPNAAVKLSPLPPVLHPDEINTAHIRVEVSGTTERPPPFRLTARWLDDEGAPNSPPIGLDYELLSATDSNGTTARFRTPPLPEVLRSTSTENPLPIRHAVAEITAEVDPLGGETHTQDNRCSVYVRVTDARIRVVVLEGAPSATGAFLARAMSRDPGVEVRVVTSIGPNPHHLLSSVLEQADVFVVGKNLERVLPPREGAADLIASAVRDRGAGLFLMRGSSGSVALDSMNPISRSAQFTELGVWSWTNDAAAWGPRTASAAEAPNSRGFRRPLRFTPVESLNPLATVLAHAGDPASPLLVTMQAGAGTVAVSTTEELWRLSLDPDRPIEAPDPLESLASVLIRRLAAGGGVVFPPGESMTAELEPAVAAPRSAVRLVVRTRSSTPPDTVLHNPGGTPTRLTLSPSTTRPFEWSAQFEPQETGLHRVELRAWSGTGDAMREHSMWFPLQVISDNTEVGSGRLGVPTELLADLAASTPGGRLLANGDTETLFQHLRTSLEGSLQPEVPEPMWNRWWWLALALGTLGGHWLYRRQHGLP